VAVIVWWLDLHLPIQSVSITANVVSPVSTHIVSKLFKNLI